MAISADGKRIVSGSTDKTIKVWRRGHGHGNPHPPGTHTAPGHVRWPSAAMAKRIITLAAAKDKTRIKDVGRLDKGVSK